MTSADLEPAGLDRRSFLRASGITAGTALFGGTALQALTVRMAEAAPQGKGRPGAGTDYGPLSPVAARNTGDQWLALPAGFSYTILTKTGAPMTDGAPTPRAHDGMGSFALAGGRTRLICNHEIRFSRGATPTQGVFTIDGTGSYDPSARGGTTTIDFDPAQFGAPNGGKLQDYVSMRGSVVNCAGGVLPAGWITSEEIVQDSTSTPPTSQRHGYNFFVPTGTPLGNAATPAPLKAMGRFPHEAAAQDSRTGIVYQTEDAGSGVGSGFYRFLPVDPNDLARGGELQMLAIKARPQSDLREGQRQGKPLPVTWVPITQPDPAGRNDVFNEGFAGGGAKFNRLEGIWDGDGSIFFASTSGGDAKNGDVNSDGFREGYGQIWEYRPRGNSGGQLILLFESPDGDVLDSPDNIVVTPRGGILICEDDSSSANLGQNDESRFFGEDKNRLIGLTMNGVAFPFAENIFSDAELAGACWSADGRFLFVNIFGEDVAGSGGSMAVTGPWERGAL
ncbi:MAG: PhoX family protein [Actinobacteria bacterium]|nr:PhoX family protein [Actinomycetota bacterium]